MTRIKLGHVVGRDAVVNGYNIVSVEGNDGISFTQDGSTLIISSPSLTSHISNTSNPHGVTAAQVGADPAGTAQTKADAALASAKNYTDGKVGTLESTINAKLDTLQTDVWSVGTTAPSNQKVLWIDTDSINGGLKYYNGSEWTHVPVAYS